MASPTDARRTGWTSIRLQNFRKFKDTGTVQYAPVTLLFGKNSSGKTSVLRAPLLIKQLLLKAAPTEPTFIGSEVDFGSYAETVHNGDVSLDMTISVDIVSNDSLINPNDRYRTLIGPDLSALLDAMHLRMRLHWNKTRARTQFSRIELSSSADAPPVITMTRTGAGKFNLEVFGQRKKRIDNELSLQSLRYLSFLGNTDPSEISPLDLLAYVLSNNLQTAAEKLVHIRPIRDEPSRAYSTNQIQIPGSASTVDVIQRSREARDLINKALKQLDIASSATIVKLAPGYVAITLVDPKTGRRDNLADVGFGVSQVLPILATLATIPEGSTILIEQPELHLHPDAQGRLADVLLELGAARRLTLVVETHSEHILLRLQRRVAERKFGPSHVTTYFVDRGKVRRADVDEFGQIERGVMPTGFFEEEWTDLLKLTEAAAKRKQ